MSESSYKVYASEEYVDQRVPPSPDGTHKMLVTDADGKQVWEDRTHWAEDNSKIYNEFSVANGTYNDEDGTFAFSVDNIPLVTDEEFEQALFEGAGGVFVDGVAYKAYLVIGSSNHLHITSMEGDITEEIPFKITVYQSNIETFLTTLPGETHDVKIGIPNVTIHPLDPKYLPVDYINELIDAKAIQLDTTLAVEGAAADAKATGDMIIKATQIITNERIDAICGGTIYSGDEVAY